MWCQPSTSSTTKRVSGALFLCGVVSEAQAAWSRNIKNGSTMQWCVSYSENFSKAVPKSWKVMSSPRWLKIFRCSRTLPLKHSKELRLPFNLPKAINEPVNVTPPMKSPKMQEVFSMVASVHVTQFHLGEIRSTNCLHTAYLIVPTHSGGCLLTICGVIETAPHLLKNLHWEKVVKVNFVSLIMAMIWSCWNFLPNLFMKYLAGHRKYHTDLQKTLRTDLKAFTIELHI